MYIPVNGIISFVLSLTEKANFVQNLSTIDHLTTIVNRYRMELLNLILP